MRQQENEVMGLVIVGCGEGVNDVWSIQFGEMIGQEFRRSMYEEQGL